mmetsp:Transcript_4251/g.13566  ORF Transcript_4251/g.13566 Transcript_4251/m.13566 type:complete len:302 (+) Transcript_4251:96-1001(+)
MLLSLAKSPMRQAIGARLGQARAGPLRTAVGGGGGCDRPRRAHHHVCHAKAPGSARRGKKGFGGALPSAMAVDPAPPEAEDDLTMHEMGKMLSEVRAHHKKEGLVDKDVVCRNLLSMRVPGLRLDRCTTKMSAIHGMGVFATRDIKKGELVTLYPGDAVFYWADGDRSPSNDFSVFFGAHIPPEGRDGKKSSTTQSKEYELRADNWTSLVGDPALVSDHAYLGHICNDGAACLKPGGKGEYEAATDAARNAEHVGLEGAHFGTRATRSISAGEEVLVTYGAGYWLSRMGFGEDGAPMPTPV